ncbi:hypothetical protein ACR820_31175 [Streptomyces netropsis]
MKGEAGAPHPLPTPRSIRDVSCAWSSPPRTGTPTLQLRGAPLVCDTPRHPCPAARKRLHRHGSRLEPTDDRAGAGRWIAIDESGYHGDQLHGGDRCMILGSVAIDDADAAAIVDTLRVDAGIQKSATELKFQKMFAGPAAGRRQHLLGDLLAPGGPLYDRASVYVIDKHYFVAAKLVDLLLEERFNAMGIDIVMNGVVRQFTLYLATEGPRAMGRDGFDRLIATAVGFFSNACRISQVLRANVTPSGMSLRRLVGRAAGASSTRPLRHTDRTSP